jgi:hypothetical protein
MRRLTKEELYRFDGTHLSRSDLRVSAGANREALRLLSPLSAGQAGARRVKPVGEEAAPPEAAPGRQSACCHPLSVLEPGTAGDPGFIQPGVQRPDRPELAPSVFGRCGPYRRLGGWRATSPRPCHCHHRSDRGAPHRCVAQLGSLKGADTMAEEWADKLSRDSGTERRAPRKSGSTQHHGHSP